MSRERAWLVRDVCRHGKLMPMTPTLSNDQRPISHCGFRGSCRRAAGCDRLRGRLQPMVKPGRTNAAESASYAMGRRRITENFLGVRTRHDSTSRHRGNIGGRPSGKIRALANTQGVNLSDVHGRSGEPWSPHGGRRVLQCPVYRRWSPTQSICAAHQTQWPGIQTDFPPSAHHSPGTHIGR